MFGLEYVLALIKILFNLAFAMVSTILFKPAWNCIAENYLVKLVDWFPEILLHIPYWHFVAFILVCTFLGEQINKLIPKLISINNSSTNNKE